MPAEWEPHEATWIGWPHNRHDWPGKFAAIPWVFAEVVRQLQLGEKVHILVNDLLHEKRARAVLDKVGVDGRQIRFFRMPTDRAWLRDTGADLHQVQGRTVGLHDLAVSTPGPSTTTGRHDCLVAGKIARKLALPVWAARFLDRPVVLEGGSIDVNGAGLLLTTEECLLSPGAGPQSRT